MVLAITKPRCPYSVTSQMQCAVKCKVELEVTLKTKAQRGYTDSPIHFISPFVQQILQYYFFKAKRQILI